MKNKNRKFRRTPSAFGRNFSASAGGIRR